MGSSSFLRAGGLCGWDGCTDETIILKAIMMRLRLGVFLLMLGAMAWAQRRPADPTVRLPSRGLRGAVAGGSEYATEAGMRMYFGGGNAVDAGIATMFAASVVEFSHFGMGG